MTPGDEEALARAIAMLREHVGVEFGGHALATLRRRIWWRAGQIGALSMAAYVDWLCKDPNELSILRSALLVQVTRFWRDLPVWHALHEFVLPHLAQGWRRDRRAARTWSAGCADGRETWTLASLLHASAPVGWLLVGSDLDPQAIAVAKRGEYPAEAALEIPVPWREQTLEPAIGLARIAAGLRHGTRFCVHDLAGVELAPSAAIVARFDLVLCRNVLIYLQPSLRDLVLRKLAAATAPGGVLVLGQAESVVGEATRWFAPFPDLPQRLRLFARTQEAL